MPLKVYFQVILFAFLLCAPSNAAPDLIPTNTSEFIAECESNPDYDCVYLINGSLWTLTLTTTNVRYYFYEDQFYNDKLGRIQFIENLDTLQTYYIAQYWEATDQPQTVDKRFQREAEFPLIETYTFREDGRPSTYTDHEQFFTITYDYYANGNLLSSAQETTFGAHIIQTQFYLDENFYGPADMEFQTGRMQRQEIYQDSFSEVQETITAINEYYEATDIVKESVTTTTLHIAEESFVTTTHSSFREDGLISREYVDQTRIEKLYEYTSSATLRRITTNEYDEEGNLINQSFQNFLQGDINGDGAIDLADFNILKTNFGANGAPGSIDALGDANSDGTINLADFNLIKTNFGALDLLTQKSQAQPQSSDRMSPIIMDSSISTHTANL